MANRRIQLFMLSWVCCLYAQGQKATAASDTRAQVVLGELGANGILFSANYDFRFAPRNNGLGMRIGIGFLGGSGGGVLTLPVGFNHLSGKGPHHFESGLGFTFITGTGDASGDEGIGDGSVLVPSIGYRYQSVGKGFVGRVVLSPLILVGGGGGWFMFGGVGAGFRFK